MTTSMQPLSKTLRVNGLALHYLEWGEAEAPPIVCVHGYTGSADAFNALARHLEDRYRILAVDVRGHGESAWSPAGAYSYADQAGDLAGKDVERHTIESHDAAEADRDIAYAEQRRAAG